MPFPCVHRRSLALLFASLLASTVALRAEEPAPGPGTTLEALKAGAITYHQVRIRSVNAHTVVIMHSGGMASIPLKSLDLEWQTRFHYDPAADVAVEPAPGSTPKPVARPVTACPAPGSTMSSVNSARRRTCAARSICGEILPAGAGVKDQGHRPSCAIFAIVSALEFKMPSWWDAPKNSPRNT